MLKKIKIKFKIKKKKSKLNLKNELQIKYLQGIKKFYFTIKQLVSVNSHLGYEIKSWNNQMRLFVFAKRTNYHILNLNITILMLKRVFILINNILILQKKLLFISENQYIDLILKKIIKLSFQYITCKRYLGGFITNFFVVSQQIKIINKKLYNLFKLKKNLIRNYYIYYKKFKKNKKILFKLIKNKINLRMNHLMLNLHKLKKMKFILDGTVGLSQIPKLVIILNGVKSKWAINEMIASRICFATLIDSITILQDRVITYPIPANTYSFSTQVFFCSIFKINILNSLLNEKKFLKKLNNL